MNHYDERDHDEEAANAAHVREENESETLAELQELAAKSTDTVWDDRPGADEAITTAELAVLTERDVHRMTDAQLERLSDWGDYPDDEDEHALAIASWVQREMDARDLWNSDDDRIRESVGNYTSHLA